MGEIRRTKMDRALESGDISLIADALSFKQRNFCHSFIKHFNGAKAVLEAGYDTPPENASRMGHQVLKADGVRPYIDHLLEERAKETHIDIDYVLRGILRTISKSEDGDKAQLTTALRGYELLAKHLGMFVEKQEVKIDGNIEYEQRVREDTAALESAITRLAQRGGKSGVAKLANSGTEG